MTQTDEQLRENGYDAARRMGFQYGGDEQDDVALFLGREFARIRNAALDEAATAAFEALADSQRPERQRVAEKVKQLLLALKTPEASR